MPANYRYLGDIINFKVLRTQGWLAELLMAGILQKQGSLINVSALCKGVEGCGASACLCYQCISMWLVIIQPKQIGNLVPNNKKQRAICFLSQARATHIIQLN